MTTAMSLKIPYERGAQLMTFADTQNLNLGEAIGVLLDHAMKTGLAGKLALPGVEITADNVGVNISLDRFALSPLSTEQARSLAENLQKVATTPGYAILDLDGRDIIEIARRGAGVIVTVHARNDGARPKHRDMQAAKFARVYPPGVASAIAERIDDACDEVWQH